MRRGRVAYAGAIHEATPAGDEAIRLADGRVVAETDVVWLPPFAPGTVIALGLNYADHARELAFKAQEEPLVFLKGPTSLIGHRGQTRRPGDATFMHYECELAVVIGRRRGDVARARAMELRRRLHGRQRLRGARLPRELVPAEPARQEPRRRDGARARGSSTPPTSRHRRRCALRTLVNGTVDAAAATPRDLVFDIAVPDRIPERAS